MAKRAKAPSRVARRLADLIDDSEHSEAEIADELGRSRTAVYEWKAGRSEPDLTTFAKLCRLLNVSADDLLEVKPRGGLPQARLVELAGYLEAARQLVGDHVTDDEREAVADEAAALVSRLRKRNRRQGAV